MGPAFGFLMVAAGPEGVSRLIPQVHNLAIGQIGEAGSFENSILVETVECDLISAAGGEALSLRIPPGPPGDFDELTI